MKKRTVATMVGTVLFLGWLWSGWAYLKGQFPMDLWEEGRVVVCAEG